MSLGVINMNSIHSCCRFHHWLGWASLPMCLVVSTWGSLQMHRRYILKIRRGKQLNKIKQVFFCVYTDLTLFHNINQHWLGSFTGSISDALLDGLIISMAATSCAQECLQSWYNNNCLFTLHSSHPGHVSVQDSVWSPPPHRCSGHQVQQLQKLQGTSKGRALQIMDWIGNEEKSMTTWMNQAFLNSTSNALLEQHHLGTPDQNDTRLHAFKICIYYYV